MNKPEPTRRDRIAEIEAAIDAGKHANISPDGTVTVSDRKPHPTIDQVLAEIGDEHNRPVTEPNQADRGRASNFMGGEVPTRHS